MKFKFSLIFVFISCSVFAQNSFLQNKETLKKVKVAIDSVYNFKFNSTKEAEEFLYNSYPNHPLPPLLTAMRMYWKHFPISAENKYKDIYLKKIAESFKHSEALLKKDSENAEAIFANLMAHMFIMQYYSDNHQSSKVIPYIKQGYSMVKKGFKLTNEITDFNFSTGLYNYYREAYPEKHPVYKPIAYFFPKGDKKLGISQLEYNTKQGTFLNAESLSFLVYISLNFEGNYKESLHYVQDLNKAYPDNLLFLSYHIRTLLLLKRYNKAELLTKELIQKNNTNQFFEMMSKIYLGIIEEKKNKDFEKAEKLYWLAINLGEQFKPFSNNRTSYAYFGLSRIYSIKSPKLSKRYRKTARELSNYNHLTFD